MKGNSEPGHLDLYSPTDYRYSVADLQQYLSAEAYTKYKIKVEGALVDTLAKHGVCSETEAQEIRSASQDVQMSEVLEEERRIGHDIRALVNVIRSRVSDRSKPYVHLTATSHDINDTANALRYRDAIRSVIIPDLVELEKEWIRIADQEKETVQIGRTHGQFASPVTFGFFMANYVERLGERIIHLVSRTRELTGKFAGSVGAYNALTLLVEDPQGFEEDLLKSLDLTPARISSQIVPPEPMVDLVHSLVSTWGVLANFCRDMRHLQRSEISEVGEAFSEEQVGSSTMPQKRNPVSFENIESLWKEFVPRMITKYLDQVSEHQRDLTNSASQRYDVEFMTVFDYCVRRLTGVSKRLVVDHESIQRNFRTATDEVAAEPIYILLASKGHPDAHEYVRKLSLEAIRKDMPPIDLLLSDESAQPYVEGLSGGQLEILRHSSLYTGIAGRKTEEVVEYWRKRMMEEHLS